MADPRVPCSESCDCVLCWDPEWDEPVDDDDLRDDCDGPDPVDLGCPADDCRGAGECLYDCYRRPPESTEPYTEGVKDGE